MKAAHPDFDGRRRVVILAIRPEIDGGRYPVKRVVGDMLDVEADFVSDGHDIPVAVLRYRHESEARWSEIPLVAAGNDTYRASVPLEQLGRYRYTVTAWIDHFASWRRGLERKHAAGADVSVELVEGALMIEAAIQRGAALGDVAKRLRGNQPMAERVAIALAPSLADDMARFPDRSLATDASKELEVLVERKLAAFSAWYEFFPRSTRKDGKHGSLRDAEAWLPYVAELGFDIVYLPPIHPIGTAYRKGPDNAPEARPGDPGSPWAIGAKEGGHTAVHPELGTLADFDQFVTAAKRHNLEVALDIAFQASPDHPWVKEHPTWFKQRPDGSIQYAENPPKKYQDVYPFDFESKDWRELWEGLRDVFLFWAQHGVRVFRVDNPHTKPIAFWEWCLREVHAKFPDSIFLSEAFTRPKLMQALAKSGFSQSYSYFTWRTTSVELRQYLEELSKPPIVDMMRPNFWPTTPDIFPEHLAHGGRPAFISRLVMAATMTANYGVYGPSYELMERTPRKGVEELAQNEKYQIRTWDLDRADSLRHVMARLNKIRRSNPALQDNRSIKFHDTDNDLLIAYSKRSGDNVILVIVNLDHHHVHRGWTDLDLEALGVSEHESFQVHDLLGDARYTWRGRRNFVELDPSAFPAHVFEVRRYVRSENQFEYFL